MSCSFELNGRAVRSVADDLTPLLTVLREELGRTGTKQGCGEGRCGSCTVILDGESVVACLTPMALVAERAVRTVEGLADEDGRLSALQDALLDAGGVQCGISTPGVLMTLTWLLEHDPSASEAAVREALAGNLCRCTGYQKIVDAALRVIGRPEATA